jgi:hypothetical protein
LKRVDHGFVNGFHGLVNQWIEVEILFVHLVDKKIGAKSPVSGGFAAGNAPKFLSDTLNSVCCQILYLKVEMDTRFMFRSAQKNTTTPLVQLRRWTPRKAAPQAAGIKRKGHL